MGRQGEDRNKVRTEQQTRKEEEETLSGSIRHRFDQRALAITLKEDGQNAEIQERRLAQSTRQRAIL